MKQHVFELFHSTKIAQKQMDCNICFEKFDRQLRKPININCGHTFCADCLNNLKARNNHSCPSCRQEIKNEQPNYTVLDLLDLNLIVDPHSSLRQDINKTYKDIEEANLDLKSKLKKIIQDQVESIKATIKDRASDLIKKIVLRQDSLIREAEQACKNLNENVEAIFVVDKIDCEKLEKQELEDLKSKLNKAKKIYFQNRNELTGIENLIEFKLDENNEYEIGKFENSDFHNICNNVMMNSKPQPHLNNSEQIFKSDQNEKCPKVQIQIQIQSNSNEFNKKGKVLHAMGKYQEAIDNYDKAIQLNPNHTSIYINKGGCLNNLGMYDEAIKCYEKAIQLNPNDALGYNGKGNSLDKMGKYKEALNFYNKAIRLNPNYAQIHLNKGVSLSCLGKCQEAIDCFDKAIHLNPNHANTFNAKGASLLVMGKFQDAIECFDKAIELKPNDANTFSAKGNCFDSLGKYKEAIACYDKAIQLNPSDAASYFNKGISLDEIGKYEEAIDCYNKAIQLNPNNQSAAENRQNALNKLKK